MIFDKNWLGDAANDEGEMIPLLTVNEEDEESEGEKEDLNSAIPILPIRNNVLFPGVVIPISVGRDRSIKAIKKAYKGDRIIGVIAQKDTQTEDPEMKDLYSIGTVARIVKMLKMPDGGTTLIIQGKRRFLLKSLISREPHLVGEVESLHDINTGDAKEMKAFMASMKEQATKIVELSQHLPDEAKLVVKNINGAAFLTHFIASNLSIDTRQKQEILEIADLKERAQKVTDYLNQELQILELKNQIQSKVRNDMEKQQRDYFLHQQMKQIQEELGGDVYTQEIERLQEKSIDKKWKKEVRKAFDKEMGKLQRINPAAAEYSVILNYLDLMLELPWGVYTNDKFDLQRARNVLEKDHYGLANIKDRILEYLAVLKLKGDMKSPILCFVGPPGVGKTSLGRSIARALNRKYVRMSLGGLHDESEIRGHRKTYIGAMPGRIVQSLKKVQSSNPVFILDEIDKVGKDFRGDPSSALLEVLDPEQNHSFYDNYLELEYDLSRVLFIATANDISSIQPALRDRMEVIRLSGYSIEEKKEIARRHLVKKQREAHGLEAGQIKLGSKSLEYLIQNYTRESGVRELDRVIASIMRSIAKSVALNEKYDVSVDPDDISRIMGKPKFQSEIYSEKHPPGICVGLAWTPVGGEILFVESSLSRGKGELTLTGNLGSVMKESATTSLTYLKSHAAQLGIDPKSFADWNVHIHIPEGAIPKDGPSAGIAILSALTSLFTQHKVKPYLAMTGEITLRGKVLPVGGVKEKILAAKRAGIKEIILSKHNERDVEEINKDFIRDMNFIYVDEMIETLQLALEDKPVPGAIDLATAK